MSDTFWNGATPVVQQADYQNAKLAVRIAGAAVDGSQDTFAQFPLSALPTDALDQATAIENLTNQVTSKADSSDVGALADAVSTLSGAVANKATTSDLAAVSGTVSALSEAVSNLSAGGASGQWVA